MHGAAVGAIIATIFVVLGVFATDVEAMGALRVMLIWTAGGLWSLAFAVLNYDHRADRSRILTVLRRRDPLRLYTRATEALLATLTRMMAPGTATDDPPPKGRWDRVTWALRPKARDEADLARLKTASPSWPVMDAALMLAVIYPLLLLLLQWGWTGTDTGIGGLTVIPAEERGWLRFALIGPIVPALAARILASASQRSVFEKAADWLTLIAFAVAVAFAFAVVVAGAGAVVFAGAVSVVFASAVVFAFAAAFAGAFAFVFAFAVTGAFAFAVAFAVAGAFAGAAAIGWACHQQRGALAYALFVLGAWVLTVAVFARVGPALPEDLRVFLFVFALLPLINAVFDFLSYDTTLGLLAWGKRQRNGWTGLAWLADALAAVVYLVSLGLALTLTVALINKVSGAVFMDLPQIFADLADPEARGGYTWLTLSLLTTLVPTLVHLALALLSALCWVPYTFRRRLADLIAQEGDLGGLWATAVAATLFTLYVALVAVGLFGIWQFLSDWIAPGGLLLLHTVAWFATVLGAL